MKYFNSLLLFSVYTALTYLYGLYLSCRDGSVLQYLMLTIVLSSAVCIAVVIELAIKKLSKRNRRNGDE